jgi:hypothetical protein
MKISRWIASICMMGLMAGCSGNHQSIYRHKPLTNSESSITTIDAKQRAIIAAKRGNSGLKFCAEPSPDVFSVVAQSLSAGGTFGQRADPKAIEAALSAAFSSSEQGSTIPRTQTINMLRELMYRTCERWLNNELGDAEMPIQAARDQRLMVSILAIEQLTGAVAPKPVVIGSAANASAGASGSDAAVRIDDAYKALTAKTAAQQARQKDFDGLNTGTNACDVLAKQVEAKEPALTPEQEQANGKCNEAKSALAQAKLERAAAAGHHQSLIDASRAGGIPASAESSADSRVAGGGLDRAHAGDVKEVAAIVKDIVQMNFQQDEFLLFCLKVLAPATNSKEDADFKEAFSSVKQTCEKHVATSIEVESARQAALAKEIRAESGRIEQEARTLFDTFWARVMDSDDIANTSKLAVAIKAVRLPESDKRCFASKSQRSDIEACFLELSDTRQEALAHGGTN